MTPDELRSARAELGEAWGKGRPLFASELGRALGYSSRDPGAPVAAWEAGRTEIPPPAARLIQAWLAGAPGPDGVFARRPGNMKHRPEAE